MAVVVLALSVLITVAVLVATGPPGGRPAARRPQRAGIADPWHGDPRPHVVERPAGADAEDMT